MTATIKRTGKKRELWSNKEEHSAEAVWTRHGYTSINALDIENHEEINWEGIEFNRLLTRDGVLFRFNSWIGAYPYQSIEIEEIGRIA